MMTLWKSLPNTAILSPANRPQLQKNNRRPETLLRKIIRTGRLFVLGTLLAVSSISCNAPTYPSGQLTQSIESLCQNEYQVNVSAWLSGGTVGVDVPVDRLYTPEFHLQEEARERLSGASEGLRRVILSTDAKPDFILVRVYEEDGDGEEFILTHYIRDMKMASAMQISRGEYGRRLSQQRRINPVVVGERAVRAFIRELESGRSAHALGTYFRRDLSRSITPAFFLYLLELEQKEDTRYEILDLKSIRISGETALVWVKLKESYQLKRRAKEGDLVYPSGFEHEWFFETVGGVYPRIIRNAAILKVGDAYGRVMRPAFPASYARWENVELWGSTPFREDVPLEFFVSEQVQRRVQSLFQPDAELNAFATVQRADCGFSTERMDDTGNLSDVFNIHVIGQRKPQAFELGTSEDPVFRGIIQVADKILTAYKYDQDACRWIRIMLAGEEPVLVSRENVRDFLK